VAQHGQQLRGTTQVDRTGQTGPFCEASPDPSIRALGIWSDDAKSDATYKRTGGAELRRARMARLHQRAPGLSIRDGVRRLEQRPSDSG
jgi:hypothetical protein